MEGTVITRSGTLRVRREWLLMPHRRLVLNGTEDVIDDDLKWSEVGISSVDLQRVLRRTRLGALLVTILPPIFSLRRGSRQSLRLLSSTLLLRRSACRAPCRLLQMYVLLGSRQDILHASDVMLHQVLVEGVVRMTSSLQL